MNICWLTWNTSLPVRQRRKVTTDYRFKISGTLRNTQRFIYSNSTPSRRGCIKTYQEEVFLSYLNFYFLPSSSIAVGHQYSPQPISWESLERQLQFAVFIPSVNLICHGKIPHAMKWNIMKMSKHVFLRFQGNAFKCTCKHELKGTSGTS